MALPQVTIIGCRLTDDPELRFTPSGAAVANFTVATNDRRYNKETSEWEDGDKAFLNCSVWREQAENVAEQLRKGSLVNVYGKLKQRSYETREGEKRTVFEVDVEEVSPSLRWLGKGGGGSRPPARQQQAAADPWGASDNQRHQQARQSDPWAQPSTDGPAPF